MEVLDQIPKTALDEFRLLPEGLLCEVIDNILCISPAVKVYALKVGFTPGKKAEQSYLNFQPW